MSLPLCEPASDYCVQREREDEEEEKEISGTEIQAINSSRVGDANVPISAVPCDMLLTRNPHRGRAIIQPGPKVIQQFADGRHPIAPHRT